MIFVTGGAGFIGANFILNWLHDSDEPVLNIDKLTYAANPATLHSLANDPRYLFSRTDICDAPAINVLFARYRPRAVVHFAAESHVDRSIQAPADFVRTNVVGTCTLLEAARTYWSAQAASEQAAFRFLHVSTDEVFGSLQPGDAPFSERSPYAPNNPYAASKAASDQFVRAYFQTYGLPVLTTHCSNNFGRFQGPEKLIPLMIVNALAGSPLPLYGDGGNVRDWIYIDDHCEALQVVLARGMVGETYCIGARNEKTNREIVNALCLAIDALRPRASGSYACQVTRVADRPGHDRRYAIDSGKLERELGWRPRHDFDAALALTVRWYLDHPEWLAELIGRNAAGVGHARDVVASSREAFVQ